MLGYIASFALSVGPVTRVIFSEIFPIAVRGRATALATVCLWAANYIVSQTFPMLDETPFVVRHFHHGFTFWIYGLLYVIQILFVWKFVPDCQLPDSTPSVPGGRQSSDQSLMPTAVAGGSCRTPAQQVAWSPRCRAHSFGSAALR
jgi:hypothetical protein